MENTVTSDMSEFGAREIDEMITILDTKVSQGLPEDFYDDGLTIMFNKMSGYVFLINSDYQVCMMNGNSLEMFHTCSNCGNEGFKEEIADENDCCNCCEELL